MASWVCSVELPEEALHCKNWEGGARVLMAVGRPEDVALKYSVKVGVARALGAWLSRRAAFTRESQKRGAGMPLREARVASTAPKASREGLERELAQDVGGTRLARALVKMGGAASVTGAGALTRHPPLAMEKEVSRVCPVAGRELNEPP